MNNIVFDWKKYENELWLRPAKLCSYLSERWQNYGKKKVLDLGCGLGRNSVYFATKGFDVTAIDISDYAISYTEKQAQDNHLDIDCRLGDFMEMDIPEDTYDAIIVYNVVFQQNTEAFKKLITKIKKALKVGGELYITLISKDTLEYVTAKNENRADRNTVVKLDEYGEKNYHFFVDICDIIEYFHGFRFVDNPVERVVYDLECIGGACAIDNKFGQQLRCRNSHFELLVQKVEE